MQGRYGADALNLAILVASLAVTLIGSLTGLHFLVFFADAGIIVAFFRMLSRDREKRMAENRWYLTHTQKPRREIAQWLERRKNSKQYHYYTCPKCHERLRVPRGVGNVTITCRKCGEKFDKKA